MIISLMSKVFTLCFVILRWFDLKTVWTSIVVKCNIILNFTFTSVGPFYSTAGNNSLIYICKSFLIL